MIIDCSMIPVGNFSQYFFMYYYIEWHSTHFLFSIMSSFSLLMFCDGLRFQLI